ADEDLPLDFNAFLTAGGRVNYVRLALVLARSPGRIRAVLRFQRRVKAAADRLAEVLLKVLACVAPQPGPKHES
ncbi:MAG: hypothetical protein RMK20_14515, partial [Verrucomicrobiales bacterium]|nr:hypothetical protein [Verrucomicrobiales bacterium]